MLVLTLQAHLSHLVITAGSLAGVFVVDGGVFARHTQASVELLRRACTESSPEALVWAPCIFTGRCRSAANAPAEVEESFHAKVRLVGGLVRPKSRPLMHPLFSEILCELLKAADKSKQA